VSMAAGEHEPHWAIGESLARVIDAVRGYSTTTKTLPDGSFLTNCVNPGHEDRRPSLHISHLITEHGGRTVFRCYSCADTASQEDFAYWCGLEYDDLFDDRRWSLHNRPAEQGLTGGRRSRRVPKPGADAPSLGRLGPLPKPIRDALPYLLADQEVPARAVEPEEEHHWVDVETYEYTRLDGLPVQRVTRQRCTDEGCTAKNFPQTFLKQGTDPASARSWIASKSKAGWGEAWQVPLYRTARVLEAIAAEQPVWVMEGEKDVAAAEEFGLVATTNAGGAGGFPEAIAKVLAGAGEVNIVLDRDTAGWARGVRVAELVERAGGPTVRLWLPAVPDAKADFYDHVRAGHTLEQLVPVPVAAVAAWDAASSKMAAAAAAVHAAAGESEAQLQVAAVDRRAGRKALAADRRRYAVRWAKEALRQHARVVEAGHKVVGHVAAVPTSSPAHAWAMEALESARGMLRAATTAVHATCEAVSELVPAAVDQARLELPAPAVAVSAAAAVVGDSRESPAEVARPDLRVVPGGGGGDRGAAVRIEHDEYEVVDGEIVQAQWRARGDRMVRTYRRIVNAELRVRAREMAEAEEDILDSVMDLAELGDRAGRTAMPTIRPLTQVTHVVLELPTPEESPAGVPPHLVRIPFDDFVNGAFLSHLPIVGLDFNGGRSGREKVVTAINHISTPELTTSYRATGWRFRPDGSAMYVTASGAIDATGWVPIATNLSGAMARFDLPEPVTEAARLREAFLTGTVPMLERFPDRIGAVLVGQAFRAAVCANEWSTVLSASPGVGKTGIASLAMHYYGEAWDRMRPMTSMSGNGATGNALRILAHQAKDAVVFLDDNAPTNGIEEAWKRLETTMRMLHNQEERQRSDRSGQEATSGTRPRTSALITTELPPRAGTSGERRGLIVPMSRRDVAIEDIQALDELGLRHRRALLMSSHLQWLAQDYRGNLQRLAGLREEFVTFLRTRSDLTGRLVERHGAKIAELWAGWGLLLEMLTEQGALSGQEADAWRARISQALVVAAESAEDPDLVESTGQRACELLRYALTNGIAFVADSTTGLAPQGLERRLGWRPGASGAEAIANGDAWRVDPRAINLGHVQLHPDGTTETGPELLCERAGLEAVIKAASSAMPDSRGMDLGTVLRALEDEGVLKVRVEKRERGIVVRRSLDRTIACLPSLVDPSRPLREKRFVLRLAEVFGESPGGFSFEGPDDDRPNGDGPGGAAPVPLLPMPGPDPAKDDTNQGREEAPTLLQETIVEYTTAGGLSLPCQPVATAPCRGCGVRAGVGFAGVPAHIPCFERTGAATVEQWLNPGQAQPAPAVEAHPVAHEDSVPPSSTPAPAPVGQRATRGQAQAASRARRFPAAVAVVDVDALWLPDGTRRELPHPVTHLGHLEQIGRELGLGMAPAAAGWSWDQAGVVVPTAALWRELGVPIDDLPKYVSQRPAWFTSISPQLAALSDAASSGWVFGRGDADPMLRLTTKLRLAGAERGSVQILMTPGLPTDWGLDDADPARLARRLQLFADAVGIAFTGSPINTALDLFHAVTKREVRERIQYVDWTQIPPARSHTLEPHFNWTRVPSQAERQLEQVRFFDRNQSYLATWSNIEIGLGEPEHHGEGFSFDPKRAGWWRITLPENTVGGVAQVAPYPDLLDPDGTAAGKERWLTTPALAYAVSKLHAQPVVHESWTWPKERATRLLDPFYKRVKAALEHLHQVDDVDAKAAAGLVKQMYKQLSGHFISSNAAERQDPMWQPYVFHATRAQARVAILNRILEIGERNQLAGRENRWPLVVSNTDMIGYAAAQDAPLSGWPGDPAHLTWTPGMYKPGRVGAMVDQVPYLTGRGWGGIDATTDPGGES